jgi:glycolate oxidase FAD binding subunit
MNAIAETLESVVGAVGGCAWSELTPMQQQQIGQALSDRATPYWVAPQTPAELAAVMTCAHRQRWRVLPCGSGSKLHWGGLAPQIDLVVSTARLNRLIEHAVGDLTVTAEAGMKFADVQAVLGQAGQFLAIDPSYGDRATLGGIIATGDTGSLRQRYNSVRDMVLGISFVRSDGELVKAGGRVVKNVAGYDLMKLLTGSYGTLGILTQVTLRVYPQPAATQAIVLSGAPEALAQALQTILNSALTPTALDALSAPLMQQVGLPPSLGLAVRFQSMAASVEQQAAQVQAIGQTLGLASQGLSEATATTLWQQLTQPMLGAEGEPGVACKIGIKPSAAVELLTTLETQLDQARVVIHAGSGLGWLVIGATGVKTTQLNAVRSFCQAHGGFLSVLQAPIAFKQQMPVWGDVGNALPLMKAIKQQFDPQQLLSPQRFVGGI